MPSTAPLFPSASWKAAKEFELEDHFSAPFWRKLKLEEIEKLANSLRPEVRCVVNKEKYAVGHNTIVTGAPISFLTSLGY